MKLNEFRIEILKKELDIISDKINHFGDLRLKTRQTCITLWTAALGVALTQKISELYFLAIFLPLPFWIIESRYRRHQRGCYLRLSAIRDFIRDETYKVKGIVDAKLEDFINNMEKPIFPAFDYWGNNTVEEKKFKKETRFINNFLSWNIIIIYFVISMIALSLVFVK